MKTARILHEVKRTYSAIAHEFDATRDRPWPEFKIFLKFLKKTYKLQATSYKLLDIGCGNGRLSHFLKNEPVQYTGIDNNRIMLRIAKKKNPKAHFRYADACKLPFPSHSFDTVWAIALLHHLPTKKLQIKTLKEMRRVLKPGGLLCLMVWNLWQPKYRKYIDKKSHAAYIPWGQDKKILRYYHAFRAAELHDLFKKTGLRIIKKLNNPHNLAYLCY